MQKRLLRAVTLVEVLIVVAILSGLVAVLMPVIRRAKRSSQQSVCASNLRQSAMALNLYVEDNQGEYPATVLLGKVVRSTSAITASYAPTKTFRCPLDRPEGRGALPLSDRREPQSFARTWFLWEGKTGQEAWDHLLTVDPNPILFRCYFHDDYTREILLSKSELASFGTFRNGLALVAHKDGSVKLDRRNDILKEPRPEIPDKSEVWNLATAVSCPVTICDGKPPEEGWRGQ